MNKQSGYVEDWLIGVAALLLGLMLLLVLALPFMKFSTAEENVSGVVYNTSNNAVISGNTTFSVRASEDTYVSEENRSTYCLPQGSPYIKLVNEAAANKDIKVNVTTEKFFEFPTAPWHCPATVKVERVK